jgi:hypothetical protein
MGTHRHRVDDEDPTPQGERAGGSDGALLVRVGSLMARVGAHGSGHASHHWYSPCDQRVCNVGSVQNGRPIVRQRPPMSST